MLFVHRSLVALSLLLGILGASTHAFPVQETPVYAPMSPGMSPPPRGGIPAFSPQRPYPSPGVDGTQIQAYGVVTINAPVWPHPAKGQTAITHVLPGTWVWILGQQNGFYATLLGTGTRGWLSCSAVRLRNGRVGNKPIIQVYGVTTVDDNLYLQPAIQAVLKGSRLKIIGNRNGFYVVILENGRQGFVTNKKVHLIPPPPGADDYGIVTIDSQLWPQPSVALQPVPKGRRVRIIGAQGDCYNAILENGRKGWLRCDEVQLEMPLPNHPPAGLPVPLTTPSMPPLSPLDTGTPPL